MKFKFFLFCKYFFRNNKGSFRKTFLFQIIGLFIGSLLVALTFGLMDGIESEISEKIRIFNYNYKINQQDIVESFDYLNSGKEEIAEIRFKDYSSIVTVNSFNSFNGFCSKISNEGNFKALTIKDFYCEDSKDSCLIQSSEYKDLLNNKSFIIVGEGLAKENNIKIGDRVKLADIININIVGGSYISDSFLVSGIYSFNFLNYDYKNVFIKETGTLFNNAKLNYFFNNKNQLHKHLDNSFKGNDDFSSLISAINLEKYIYVSLSIFILIVSSIMIFNNTIILLLEKKHQFKLLYSQGLSRKNILEGCLLFSILLSFLISSLGYSTSLLFYYLNEKINLMKYLFIYSPFNKIPIIISFDKYILNMSIVVVLTFIATIFSLYIIDKDNEGI